MILKSALARTVPGLTSAEYLADASWSRVPSLNASIAHTLVSESPAHAYVKHPRLGGGAREPLGTKAMQDGTIVHRLLLGKGKDFAPIDAGDFRTNAAKDAREAANAAGKIPILQYQLAQKTAIAARLRDKCAALGYELGGPSTELVIRWADVCDGASVECRSMLDQVDVERGRIIELKTTADANPRSIARRFLDMGFDIQYCAHSRALARLVPEFEGRIDMTFLFLELTEPFSVVPCHLDGAFREIGCLRWESALRLWQKCLSSGRWPGYHVGDRPVMLEAPQWDVAREIGNAF